MLCNIISESFNYFIHLYDYNLIYNLIFFDGHSQSAHFNGQYQLGPNVLAFA